MRLVNFIYAFILFGVAPAFAQDAAPAASCQGLDSPTDSKKLESNLQRRKARHQQLCGERGQMTKRLEVVKDRLKACKELGKDLQGNTHSIPVDSVIPLYERRLQEVCKGVEDNVEQMGKLCGSYGATARNAGQMPGRVQDIQNGTGGESAPFHALAGEFGKLSREYKGHREAAGTEANRLSSRLSDISEDGKDDDLGKNIGLLKLQVQGYTRYMEEQAKRKLTERNAHADETNPDNSVTMRWRTQADVKQFYTNLGKCKQVVKDGGDLDKYKEGIDSTLGKTLQEARAEAGDIAKHLQEKEQEATTAMRENDQRAGRIRTAEIDERAAAAPPVQRERSNPAPLNEAYARGNELGRDYASLAEEAKTCSPSSTSCYHLDGYELGNNRSQCFKKGFERICVTKP